MAFKTRIVNGVVLFLCLTLLYGCTKSREDGKALRIGIENAIERLDPLTMKEPYTFRVGWQIFEGLVSLDEAGNTVPRLAEKWEHSPDFKEWTFHLRPGVFFHSSDMFKTANKTRTVTANDVVASMTGYCSSGAYPAFMLIDSIAGADAYNQKKAATVTGLKAINDLTVKITLKDGEPFFLDRINSPWFGIFPREVMENKLAVWGESVVVGTGPYRLKEKTENIIVLEKNSNYWQKGTPKLDRIVFTVLRNDQIRFSELKKGNIDLMIATKSLLPEILDKNGKLSEAYVENFELKLFPSFNSHFLGLNLKQVQDVHLRKAITHAINRQEIVEKVLYHLGDVNTGTIPLNMKNFPERARADYQKDLYDPEMAITELKKSGYGGEKIEILIHDKEGSEQIGEIVQQYLKRVGIQTTLVKLDYSSLLSKMLKGDTKIFNFYIDYVFSAPEPVLFNMFTSMKIPVPNVWGLNNQEIDSQIFALRKIDDRTKSFEKSLEIQKKILDIVPAVFLYQQKNAIIYRKDFKNLKINGYYHYMLEEIEKPAK